MPPISQQQKCFIFNNSSLLSLSTVLDSAGVLYSTVSCLKINKQDFSIESVDQNEEI